MSTDHHSSSNSPLKALISWFAQNPVAANLLMILTIVAGMYAAGGLRKEAFPELDPDSISISVVYRSGSAKQSEEGIAIKIEQALEDVIGIKTISSSSSANSASVSVQMQSGYDFDELFSDVRSKVDAISNFPALAQNPVITKGRRSASAITLQLFGDVDRASLQQIAETLKDDLLDDDNINSVNYAGWIDPMMAIEIDEVRLRAYDLSLDDVESAINANSSNTSTAVLRNQDLYVQLKASEQAYFATEFASIPLITSRSGTRILLGDVAYIRDTFDDTTSVLSRYNGHNSVALNVLSTGADDVTKTVESTLKVVQEWRDQGKLPQGIELIAWDDNSERIKDRLSLLVKNAVGGIVLVFLMLALFLNLRVALWVAAGLPFIFFGSLFFMSLGQIDLTLNMFTTFGFIMALGIVVDDAVVIGESVYTTRQRYGDTLANTIRGTMLVATPTLFGVLTTVAAFTSLSSIEGRLGQLYAQFAGIVTICLLLSMVESKLILPAHLAHLPTQRKANKRGIAGWWGRLQNGADAGLNWFSQKCYRPTIEVALKHRYSVLILAIALFITVIAMPFNGAVRISFFPDIIGTTVRASISMEKDASYGQTHRALQYVEQQAQKADSLLRVKTGEEKSGIAHLNVLSSSDQSGRITIELAPDSPYNIIAFTRKLKEITHLPEAVKTLSIQNTRRSVDALRIELRSNDDAVLEEAGEQFKRILLANPAVSAVTDNLDPTQPRLQLKLTALGRSLGLTTDRLAAQMFQGFSGQVIQRYQRANDEIEVKVRYPEEARQSLSDVLATRIRTQDGNVVPLSSVATVSYGYTRDSITRIDGKRAVSISADIDKEAQSVTELVDQLRSTVAPSMERQFTGLSIHFAGEAEEQRETASSMEKVFALSMLVIYLLLAIPLKSYVQPVLIMTAIPFGIVGAILGHWLVGMPLAIMSLHGIIALSGVVVNDSLLLVSRFNELKHDYEQVSDAIFEAACSRLRAVLLTSITTYAGLMPLLSETSIQSEFLKPAAISLGYGILFATVITLILIPVLVLISADVQSVWQRIRQGWRSKFNANSITR